MFDINGFELLIIAVLAVILIGPDRLPEYVKGLNSVVKRVRSLLADGRTALRDEFGDDVDWTQYDPRQYDPRRIVREALMEDDEVPASSRRSRRAAAAGSTPASGTMPAAVAVAAAASPAAGVGTAGFSAIDAISIDPDATPMLGNPIVGDGGEVATATHYDPDAT